MASPLTWTLFLPVVMAPLDVRFTSIGYNCCKCCPGQFEHIHFQNFGSSPVNITGWRIRSAATGDSFTFPSATAQPYTTSVNTEMTLLTNNDTVNNITSFNWGKSYEEWPNSAGPGDAGYLYDNLDRLIATCHYTPTHDGSGDAPCQ